MTLGYDKSLYILAFDHRSSFQKLLGITNKPPTPEDVSRTKEAKMVIFEGFEKALAGPVGAGSAGLLVDEQYGTDVARKASTNGFTLAMPVERSGQNEFDFEFGEDFGKHIKDFNPTFSKVLVRYNPEGDKEMNVRQSERLRRLGDWLHSEDRKFLFELLVPAEPSQLDSVGGSVDRYDEETRPGLMLRTIEELQDAGVEPDIWKIEGISDRDSCRRITEVVRRDGRIGVGCVVLGRGADDAKVDEWLRAGSGLEGYVGFAIGRSIFGEAMTGIGSGALDRAAATDSIARKYTRFIEVYQKG